MDRIASKKPKKIPLLVPNDRPGVGVTPFPVAEWSSLPSTNMCVILSKKPKKIPLLVPNDRPGVGVTPFPVAEWSSLPSTNMCGIVSKKPKKMYKKSHQRKPFTGSFHSKRLIVHTKIRILSKKPKKIPLLVPNDRPGVGVTPFPVAEWSSLPSTNMGSGIVSKKPKKMYKKSHLGKPFAGSFHSKGLIVHEKMGIETKQPNSVSRRGARHT